MQRRQFIAGLAVVPVAGAVVTLLGCGDRRLSALAADRPKTTGSLQSFAFYEPLGETDAHDPGETDGTDSGMPCIAASDIAAGVDKAYDFWHGHGGVNHKFTLTADHFKQLQQGKDVLLYTTMVEDHRHPLQVTLATPCQTNCPA